MDMNNLTIFSPPKSNSIKDYSRFQNSKLYIKMLSDKIPNTMRMSSSGFKLMNESGYRKYQKFMEHRKGWDNLERDIPISYFNGIGVDLEQLKIAISIDIFEYEQAVNIPRFPKYATVRFGPCIYKNYQFEDNTPLEEAINKLTDLYISKGLRCVINFSDIKSIWLEPDGESHISYYPPTIHIGNKMVIVSGSGAGIGSVRIG